MTIAFDQTVIVENRTGANALLATETVARAEADGYTLLFASLSHNVNRITSKEAKYHPVKDFAPITLAATLPLLLVTHPGAPFNSVGELIALAKTKPDTITFGSAGNFSSAHLATAVLERQAGVKMTHVPFRGNAPALAEVIAGRVSFMFYPMIGIADQVAEKAAQGDRGRHGEAPSGLSRCADHGRAGHREFRGHRSLGRHAGAGRHAGRHRQEAQRRGAEARWRTRRRSSASRRSAPSWSATRRRNSEPISRRTSNAGSASSRHQG